MGGDDRELPTISIKHFSSRASSYSPLGDGKDLITFNIT